MKGGLAVLAAMLVVACGSPAPTGSTGPQPTTYPFPSGSGELNPTVDCGPFAAALCREMVDVVLDAAVDWNGQPADVALDDGIWWPRAGEGCFDSSCGAWGKPTDDGGTWVGSALIDYRDSAARGFVNVERIGDRVHGVLVAIEMPAAGPSDPGPS